MMTKYRLTPVVGGEHAKKKNLEWLYKNNDVRIDYRTDGVSIHNICSTDVRTKKNGEIKNIPISICSEVIKGGGKIIINNKTFIVELPR